MNIDETAFTSIELGESIPTTPIDRDARDAEEQKRIAESYKKQRIESAMRRIPIDFCDEIDRTRTGIDLKSMDSVSRWDGKRSIYAKGMSQLGKTRSIYALLLDQFVNHERNFIVLDERKILAKVTDAFGEKGIEELDRKLCNVDILFLDDLDKVNFTNGVMAQNALTLIFGVIKDRMANRKPTFITMNTSITEVFQSAGAAVTQSLIERMKQDEHWQVEVFTPTTTTEK